MARLLNSTHFKACILLIALMFATPSVAFPADSDTLNGYWVLDTAKSKFGKMQQPTNVTLEVSQQGGQLHYTGTVTYASEERRDFVFDGAMDGRQYPVMRSYGNGQMSIVRKNPLVFQTEFKSDDGQYTETSLIVLSNDRNTLTRQMKLQSPVGDRTWVEVYRRR